MYVYVCTWSSCTPDYIPSPLTAVADSGGAAKRPRRSPQSGCPHYKPDQLDDLSGLALAEVQDIEQLVAKGKGLGACPYYGSRRAVRLAEVRR